MRCFARLRPSLRAAHHAGVGSPTPLARSAAADDAAQQASRSPARPRPIKPQAKLTPEEIAQVHRLVPRLCDSGRLPKAVRLLDACLLAATPPESLPLPVLFRRICRGDEPGMTHAMALLRNPGCSPGTLAAICSMLVDSYLEHGRARDALKVFDWMSRPNSPCLPGAAVCRKVVEGLCRHGRTVDALRVAKELVNRCGRGGGTVDADLRACIRSSLLREARVKEALELDGVLAGAEEGDEGACEGAMEVLERMIKDWQDGP